LSKIEHVQSWLIKSEVFVGRQNQMIFAWPTTDFCLATVLADKIKRFCQLSDIRFSNYSYC